MLFILLSGSAPAYSKSDICYASIGVSAPASAVGVISIYALGHNYDLKWNYRLERLPDLISNGGLSIWKIDGGELKAFVVDAEIPFVVTAVSVQTEDAEIYEILKALRPQSCAGIIQSLMG